MAKQLAELSNKFMGKFSTQPQYVQAIQFTNSPENLEMLHQLTNGKFSVENGDTDFPILNAEVGYLALTLTLNDWLVCKSEEKAKWTSYNDGAFRENYQAVDVNWLKYPENQPISLSVFRCYGWTNKGTEFAVKHQFYAYWNGEKFGDKNGEDLIGINDGVEYFYLIDTLPNPE